MAKGMQRRLAAIVALDVAGYSRLIGTDEEGTLGAMRAHRRQLIDPLLAEHGGRVANTAGDSLLLEFPSVVDAVRCAIAVQLGMVQRNEAVKEDCRILFRIGINVGDVVAEGDDLLGDGVNVAARLQALCDPGGLTLSDDAYRQVRDRVDVAWADGGQQRVKNITRAIQIWNWTTAEASLTTDPTDHEDFASLLDKPSIAVLPFSNMSGDPEQEYFADGITEDIITALTHWRSFPVIARNSCFAYKNRSVGIKQVGRELGSRYLLEGSVRKGGSRVRITAQLIDGVNGHHIWAEKYDHELHDIFAVQDDIVQRIVAVVAPEVSKAELKRSTRKRDQNLDAWDLCLRATPLIRERTREGNAEARELYLRAIAIRPDYADAFSGLANTYNMDILIDVARDRTTTATQAMEAARRAIECDPASSEAYHQLSTAYQWLNRLDDALAEARMAVELNPNDAAVLHALGNKSDLAGDPNGVAFMERAQKLNPQDAQLHTHLTFLARAHVNVGNLDAAVERARQALRRRPRFAPAHYILALALAELGRLNEARAALAMCDEFSPGFVQSRRDWQPYADPASNRRLQEALRRITGRTKGSGEFR